MKTRKWLLTALAVVLVLSAGIGSAWGYFTTYATAQGGLPVTFGGGGELYEGYQTWTKTVTVVNKADVSGEDICVRARAYGPDHYYVGLLDGDERSVDLTYTVGGTGWTDGGDGWYYYNTPLAPGAKTEELNVQIVGGTVLTEMPGLEDGDAFNVVVVYESAPMIYVDGKALPVTDSRIWEQDLTVDETIGEVG